MNISNKINNLLFMMATHYHENGLQLSWKRHIERIDSLVAQKVEE